MSGRPQYRGNPRDTSKAMAVTVQTNCFEIKRLPQREYFLYDSYQPDVSNFRKRQELFHQLQVNIAPQVFNPRGIYDGKALMYASHRLQLPAGGSGSYLVGFFQNKPAVEGARGTYRISLKLTAGETIRPSDLQNLVKMKPEGATLNMTTAMNLLQLLISQETNQKYAHKAHAFFSSSDTTYVGQGIELWRGYFQSVRPGIGRMLINIDTTVTAMICAGNLVDLAMQVLNIKNVRDLALNETQQNFHRLRKFLNNVLVVPETINRTKVIHGLIVNAGNYEFQNSDGRTVTVAEHFRVTYNLHIRYPGIVGVRLSTHDAPKQIVVPMEICKVKEGQFFKQKLPEACTRDAVKFATLQPQERLNAITGNGSRSSKMQSPITSYQNSSFIVESGMLIDQKPITVWGQLLAVPKVKFGKNNVAPQNGNWNVVGQCLKKPAPLTCWALINFVEAFGSSHQLSEFVEALMSCCNSLGMAVFEPEIIPGGNGQAAERVLNSAVTALKRKVQESGGAIGAVTPILVVILPQNAAELRQRIKFWSDITAGIRTQCLREQKVARANNQYWNNIAIKLNARLGGYNFLVDSPAIANLKRGGRYMIMGADVGHPGPGVQRPSITSLVWSRDADAVSYVAFTGIQHPRMETISNLKQMVEEAIDRFGQINNGPPVQILFFRDGVSEGEFQTVAPTEIRAIEDAIEDIWKKRNVHTLKPKLSYIIVGKRHHIAFFPQQGTPAHDGKGNCVAGFVNDRDDLGNPLAMDFYLQSHGAIQGTSRSSHYTVIKDEVYNFDLAKVQELAFALCHVYAKATRSVSIPAPVYYADLVCSRVAFYFSPASSLHFNSDASSTGSGKDAFNIDAWQEEFRQVNKAVAPSMYFL